VKGALLCSIRPILVIRVLSPLDFLPSPGQQEPIGKVAHFAEYAGLLLLLHRALSRGKMENGRGKMDKLPGFHSWPELRAGRYFDRLNTGIGYDLVGMIAALGLIWMWERGRPPP